MSLSLPPVSIVRQNRATAEYIGEQLTSVIAGHAQATTTYRFYEEVDMWLGPWGKTGYPIAYGKFYNIAFTTNESLMANPNTANWVWKTTILLQEAMRDYIVKSVHEENLHLITERSLRQAAFDSHPKAYDQGGLGLVVMVAPELIPIIATIPMSEFLPTSENFSSSVEQVFTTLTYITANIVSNTMTTLFPAHTRGMTRMGVWQQAMRSDRRRLLNEMNLASELGMIKRRIERAELDHIPWLDEIINRLNARQFPNQKFARHAREVVQAAEKRKAILTKKYQNLLVQSPEVQKRVNTQYPTIR